VAWLSERPETKHSDGREHTTANRRIWFALRIGERFRAPGGTLSRLEQAMAELRIGDFPAVRLDACFLEDLRIEILTLLARRA